MCGIAGILSPDPANISRQRLKKMTDAIAHRGPDGEDAWINPSGQVGLGHRRLAIIDLSPAAAQPMHYLDRYTILHNGEIYNYLELRSLLQSKGYHFTSASDTEVILAAYDHYGSECLQYFDGMFAFAIWDERERKLFAARDRFGEKPLFYFKDATQFLFASEMKALWAAGVKKESNRKLIFNFITIGYTQNPANGFETFYNGICKLPARSFLVYQADSGQLTTSLYWDIRIGDSYSPGEDDAIRQFTGLLSASIRRRMRCDVPLGTSLSGGLDSSSVVASLFAQKGHPRRLQTFSAIFPGYEKDESGFIRLVSERFPIDSHTIEPCATDLVKDFEKLVYHQEEPFLSSSVYAQFKVFGLAGSHGVKVLLDGQGADELLAGYHKYYHWYWQELYRNDKKAFVLELEAARESGVDDRWTWRNRLAANLPVYAGIFLKKKRTAAQRSSKGLSRDFVGQFGFSYYDIPHFDRLNGVLYYNTFMNGMEELLRYADRSSMAHGVEVRLPFLDHELVEFLFSLPSHFKIREGWTKWLLRTSMENDLPKEIVWRKDKTGYEPPQRSWMQHPALQEYIHEARRQLVKAKILAPAVLHKKIQPQDAHAAENNDWRYLVTAACLTS
ncbi:asparagine synthase (glutamine-hydrolyzing) [Flavitalea sp. BT771]|uniref:asparagine synthase (glutamine-hydrolyzing) n=1 Tax=Flavitalea sp. BT771 TaxID=3063329 RepID=UPI0026E40088|nr:asparagine synthase (glutamine-hydrolyzing) [Flavitalea sp. BT771]MDO6434327.1 asparagine synthase (glutamine-hydrolyzing) [Flavitalea sp. BT771]MDV6223227.1 asparagine synthase (glutamine-hydrolyzing) [Flavitalea sp. BT771]